MKKLIIGTTNQAKITQMRDALAPVGIKVEGVIDKKLLPEIVEDGTTAHLHQQEKRQINTRIPARVNPN